jgi:LysR family transcriptional regulator of gallate degradation
MSINFRRLQVFVAVAEHRSVTGAARYLNMTPPAVTKSLRELETGLAVELFNRTSVGMIPTMAGESFLLHATRALREIDRGRDEITRLSGGESGRISFGATVEAAMLVLPRALGNMIEKRRQIEVSFSGGTYESLARGVRSGELDFFLGVIPEEGVSADLAIEPLYADALHVVARPGHPLASRENLKLAELTDYRWIVSTVDGPLTRLMRRSFDQSGVPFPDNPVIVEPLSSVRGLLLATDLLTAVPQVRAREELELGQLIRLPVDLPETHHIVHIVRRSEPYQSVWAKEFIKLLRRSAQLFGMAIEPNADLNLTGH